MTSYQLGEVEMRFADIIWRHEPVPSGELVRLAQEALSWKKSTTYTIIRKLCEKGLFQNENGVVTALITKEGYKSAQSERFVDETFSGSLPGFLAAFSRGKKLSDEDVTELQKLIDAQREG